MNWIISVALLAWPLFWITSVMLFGGPGAANNLSNYITVIVCLSYPVIIFGIYWLFDWSFFSISGRTMFVGSLVVVYGLLFATGYPQALWNLSQGILNEGYSVAGKTAYYNGEELVGAEASSFEILTTSPSSPKERAPYARDSSHVYFRGTRLSGIDAPTFSILSQSTTASYLYAKDKSNVYYVDRFDEEPRLIEGSDPASFSLITEEHPDYWRDERHAYYSGEVISGANPAVFKPAPEADKSYWVDDNAVYFKGEVLPNAAPETFRSFKEEPYHFTQSVGQNGERHIYWTGQRIPVSNSSSFKVLNYEFSMDEDDVFYKAEPILTGHDLGSFKLLEGAAYFAADDSHVYNLSKGHARIIEGADPNTVVVLGNGYLKDQERVYYRADYESPVKRVEGADAQSFDVIGYDDEHKAEARDKSRYYYHGVQVDATETP